MTATFGERLRQMMIARGLDAQALAERSGVHRVTIGNALAGKTVVMATATRLARALASTPPLPLMEELTGPAPAEPGKEMSDPATNEVAL